MRCFLFGSAMCVLLSADALAASPWQTQLWPAPSLRVGNTDGWYAKTRGRIEMDFVHIEDDQANHRAGIEDRRSRFGFVAGYGKHWSAITELDISGNDLVYTDVLVRYDNKENMYITFGNLEESFGVERVQSSADTLFNEAAAIETFTPKRNLGAQITRYGNRASFTAGLFTDSFESNANKDKIALTTRATYVAPIVGGKLHSGVAASWRKMDQVRFSARPDTALTNINVVSTGKLRDADSLRQLGLEAAYGWQNIMLSAEYMLNEVGRENTDNAQFYGWYTQAAWAITGEHYKYDVSKGAIFQALKPENAFNPQKGHWGALELAGRFQTISLNDVVVQGGALRAVTGGINWYPQAAWRVTGNATYTSSDAKAVTPYDNPITLALRVRLAF
ncbi:MAG: OprO/OprP family phosphate-selective porin [Alphaproteobacteria bacterium]|nr:OprO/OprP family phosphate-selective porin [Alphaproteobacteria bacterium]